MTPCQELKQTLEHMHVPYQEHLTEDGFYRILRVDYWQLDLWFHNGSSQLYSHSEAHERKPYS